MTYQTLMVERRGWRLDVTLNRPDSRNAMNGAMVAELAAVFTEAAGDKALRCVVLRGAGGTFCSGGDLRDMGDAKALPLDGGGLGGGGVDGNAPADLRPPHPNPSPSRRGAPPDARAALTYLNRRFGAMLEAAQGLPQVLIAVVEGSAMGGGFGLAAVADLVLARDDARFAMPEVRLGIVPAQIAPFVVRRIGLAATRRLALTGGSLRAAEAQALGLVQMVEPENRLESRLAELIDSVRQSAPEAVAATKRLLLAVAEQPLSEVLDQGAEAFASAVLNAEAPQGIAAFLSKKPAPWVEVEGAA